VLRWREEFRPSGEACKPEERSRSMSVDGTWNMTVNSPMGAQPGTLALKANGSALEGTMTGPQGALALEDGKIDGNSVSWTLNVAQMGMKINFSGTVDGDKMSGEAELGSFGKATFVGTRA
jgi:hypothetical protein